MNLNNLTSLENTLEAAGLRVDKIHFDKLVRCRTHDDTGNQRSGWYRVFDGDRAVAVFGDWRSSEKGVWLADNEAMTALDRERTQRLIEQARHERQRQQAAEWLDNGARLMDMHNECVVITEGDAVCRYLQRRGIPRPVTPALLRHDNLAYWGPSGFLGSFTSMIGLVTDPAGKLVNVHRTYLSDDGKKAPVDIPRKLMASAGLMAGASIKLGAPVPHKESGMMIGIAEGIETALAASVLGGLPVWSCVSAHGLRTFVPPEDIHHVYVFGDNDASGVGQEAANECAQRLARQGYTARVLIPDSIGDWNDELMARRAAV